MIKRIGPHTRELPGTPQMKAKLLRTPMIKRRHEYTAYYCVTLKKNREELVQQSPATPVLSPATKARVDAVCGITTKANTNTGSFIPSKDTPDSDARIQKLRNASLNV
jgi:hypothetical protein